VVTARRLDFLMGVGTQKMPEIQGVLHTTVPRMHDFWSSQSLIKNTARIALIDQVLPF
jgi:hypothetical protein